MNYFLAFIAGIIQGVTEFLPISSSGHLVFFHDVLGFNLPDNLLFDVALHLGTLFALLAFFRKDIIRFAVGFFRSFTNWNLRHDADQRLPWFIVIGTIPAVFTGYFFENIIDSAFRNIFSVSLALIIVGAFLYLADRFWAGSVDLEKITFKNSFLIGLAQSLALIPGVSRSGITIISGLGAKLKREAAARFSFLLSVPAVFGASLKKIIDIQAFNNSDLILLGIGMVSASFTGYFCLKFFLKYLNNHSLRIFAYYRIILGFIMLLSLSFGIWKI